MKLWGVAFNQLPSETYTFARYRILDMTCRANSTWLVYLTTGIWHCVLFILLAVDDFYRNIELLHFVLIVAVKST